MYIIKYNEHSYASGMMPIDIESNIFCPVRFSNNITKYSLRVARNLVKNEIILLDAEPEYLLIEYVPN